MTDTGNLQTDGNIAPHEDRGIEKPARKLRKGAKESYYTEVHEILDGRVKVVKTRKSGEYFSFVAWIPQEKKYITRTTKRKNLDDAKEAAKDIYLDILARVRIGESVFSKYLSEVISEYLAVKESEARLGVITEGRIGTLKSFSKWLQTYVGNRRLSEIKATDFEGYFEWRRQKAPKVRWCTLRNERGFIGSVFKFAIERGYLPASFGRPRFPKIRSRAKDVERRDAFSREELETLKSFVERWHLPVGDAEERYHRKMVRDLVLIALATGCRLGELRKLRWNMISTFQSGEERMVEIKVPKDTKTGSRVVYAREAELFERLARYAKWTGKSDYVFASASGEPLSRRVIYDLWKEIMVDCGFKASGKKLTFYSLRHSHISEAILNGADAFLLSENVGTSLKHIQNTYYHAEKERVLRGLFGRDGSV